MNYDYDIIIIGGGPAGASCALFARKLGLKTLLLDKKSFPRDKFCGDAITGKSTRYLKELNLFDKLEKSPMAVIKMITMTSPKGDQIDLDLNPPGTNFNSKGYVCRREVFDDILFQEAKTKSDHKENFNVKDILINEGQVYGISGINSEGKTEKYTSKVVVGADGFSSIVARKVGTFQRKEEHWAIATRAYYSGIKGLKNSLEVYYPKEIHPGYLWIFPLEDGKANVGLGMLEKYLKLKNINIKKAHEKALESDLLKERFKDAKLLGKIQGANLPIGSFKRNVHGNGYVLIGDAAGLIDPFTGEGIGNAMHSAKIASEVLKKVCHGKNFTQNELNEYHDLLFKSLDPEFNLSYKMQLLARHLPSVMNFVVRKAKKHKDINDWLSHILAGTADMKSLVSPKTYLKLLFK